MTEYDFSPEAYERYLATQNRIARWVDETERHKTEFEHPFRAPAPVAAAAAAINDDEIDRERSVSTFE